MYITRRNDGGMFLALFTHNEGLAEEEANPPVLGPVYPPWRQQERIESKHAGQCSCAGEPYYYAKYCPVHKSTYVLPNTNQHKLYAYVGRVTLKQLGHFMMGNIRIGNQWLTVSGTYGSNGNSMDYEKVLPQYRHHLVEVPDNIADIFWAGEGGHNSAGSEGPAMHKYGHGLLWDKIQKNAVVKR
jgi:hypothetical protein